MSNTGLLADRFVSWRNRMPQDWETSPVKYATRMNAEVLSETTNPDFEFDYLDIGNVSDEGRVLGVERMRFDAAPSRARRVVSNGDVLVSTVRTYLKAIAHAPPVSSQLVCSTGFAVLTPCAYLDSRFLFYWARSSFFVGEVVARSTGVSYPAINPSDLGQLPVPEIPFDQQRSIAAFLDAKLGRLNELVGKKGRQLALLAEKRQALISHAVTRGLNPKAKTKSSGIPQLGDVPAHWTPTRLKYLARIRYGLGQPPKSQADGVKMIRATNVDAGRITPENMALIDPSEVPESRDATLAAGEIIVVRSGAYTCDSAIIPPEYEGAIAGYDMIVRVKKAEPEFVAFSLLSGPVRDAQLKPCSLRAAQPHLNAEELGDCVLAVPPREEQQAIVNFLKTVTARLDAVAAAIKSQHTKLCEYRQALITGAVTGQVAIPEEAK